MSQDIRHVIFHRPGPNWIVGRPAVEQPGVRQHVMHYRRWLAAGKLDLGGPHVDPTGGGMMIPAPGVSAEEARAFASEDPAVADGTLLYDVRPWLVGMHK